MLMRRFFTLLCFLLVMSSLWAYDVKVGELYYNFTSDSTVELTHEVYMSPTNYAGLTEVVVPSEVMYDGKNYAVTMLSNMAFMYASSLKSVDISEGVSGIGAFAFAGCASLMSINFPKSINSVGVDAFANVPWYDNQPDGVVYVNDYLYKYKGTMPANTTIKVKDGVTSIGAAAFAGCSSLVGIELPNSLLYIQYQAFAGCSSLTEVLIPENVEWLDEDAFAFCSSLTSVVIPKRTLYINPGVFRSCSSLDSIVVKEGNPVYDSREHCNAIIETTTNRLLVGCKSTVIPKSVTGIAYVAFYGCTGLSTIVIPKGVTLIEEGVFYGCTGLTSVVCHAETPPIVEAHTFDAEMYKGILSVPCSALDVYKADVYWGKFATIQCFEEDNTDLREGMVLGVRVNTGRVECEDPYTIYDMSGRDVTAQNGNLQGVYVVRTVKGVTKVVL